MAGPLTYAKDEAGRTAIRGKVESVNVQLYVDGVFRWMKDLDPKWWPSQPNNMTLWFHRTVQALVSRLMSEVVKNIAVFEANIDYLLNDQALFIDGIKTGRGSQENTFTFIVRPDTPTENVKESVKIVLTIRSRSYQSAWKERMVKEGRINKRERIVERLPGGGYFVEDDGED